jgi:hypothetical protein
MGPWAGVAHGPVFVDSDRYHAFPFFRVPQSVTSKPIALAMAALVSMVWSAAAVSLA